MMESKIRKIKPEQADSIIDSRQPMGFFYVLDAGVYVGIDNSTGNAWTEEFQSLRKCKKWLNNPYVEAEGM